MFSDESHGWASIVSNSTPDIGLDVEPQLRWVSGCPLQIVGRGVVKLITCCVLEKHVSGYAVERRIFCYLENLVFGWLERAVKSSKNNEREDNLAVISPSVRTP